MLSPQHSVCGAACLVSAKQNLFFGICCPGLARGFLQTACSQVTSLLCWAARQFGYTVYRRVLGYYSGEEDAFDMRKAMSRDVSRRSVIPLKRPVKPEELECD